MRALVPSSLPPSLPISDPSLRLFSPPLVYDSGAVFDPSVLDITDDDILKKFMEVSYLFI